MKKFLLSTALVGAGLFALAGCELPADVASRNISLDADNFRVVREISFYNAIQDVNAYTVIGACSIGNNDPAGMVGITCKQPDGSFEKHIIVLSDNMSVLSKQIGGVNVSTFHTKVFVRPQSIIPDVAIQFSTDPASVPSVERLDQ